MPRPSPVYGLYPVMRSRNLNLFGLVSLDDKHFNDKLFGTTQKKSLERSARCRSSGDARDDLLSGGVNTFELIALRGKLDYARQRCQRQPDELRPAPHLRLRGCRTWSTTGCCCSAASAASTRSTTSTAPSSSSSAVPTGCAPSRPAKAPATPALVALARAALPAARGMVRTDRRASWSSAPSSTSARSSSGTSRPTSTCSRSSFVNRSTLTGVGLRRRLGPAARLLARACRSPSRSAAKRSTTPRRVRASISSPTRRSDASSPTATDT